MVPLTRDWILFLLRRSGKPSEPIVFCLDRVISRAPKAEPTFFRGQISRGAFFLVLLLCVFEGPINVIHTYSCQYVTMFMELFPHAHCNTGSQKSINSGQNFPMGALKPKEDGGINVFAFSFVLLIESSWYLLGSLWVG